MSSSSRSRLATLLALALALSLISCRPAGRKASDKLVAEIRRSAPTGYRGYDRDSGWDNDSVIDAYVDVIAHDEERRTRAALNLSMGWGIQKWERRSDSRALDFMLPARIAPILLAALREDTPQWPQFRGALLLALGPIDEPTPEIVAAVRRGFTDSNPSVAKDAVKAAGMLGHHAAELAVDLERMLGAGGIRRLVSWDGAGVRWDGRLEVAASLARVSERVHPEALDVLIQAARSEGSGDRAIRHLGDLGPRAGPAADVLMDALADGDVNVLRVVGAIVAVAPDRTPAVLATLVGRAASEDVQVARAVDQLVAGLKWIHREDSRQGAGGSGPPRGVPEFVVPIVGISGGTRLRALAVLTEIARGENDGPARRAVEVLRDLGPAAGPAADDLMAILREKDLRRPRVAAAVVATSPALLPTVVSLLANLAVSGDETDARFADRELVNLSQNDGPVPGRLPESPAVVSTLVAALEARPASDGAGLAAALRRIDGPAARKAYNAFVRRERIEARESGSE